MCADEHDDKVLKSNGGKNHELSKNRNENNVYYKTVSSDKPVTSHARNTLSGSKVISSDLRRVRNTANDSNADKCKLPREKGVNIAHLNIDSLSSKVDQLSHFMYSNEVHIMAVCETKLDEHISDDVISVNNYSIYRNDRNTHGGGVALYVNDVNITEHKLREDLMQHSLELLAIEIKLSMAKPIIIIVWYRPPKSCSNQIDIFESVLQEIELENKDIVILGDVNCDLLLDTPDYQTRKLNGVCNSFHLQQLITEATRVTETTETLLDHIYTNNIDKVNGSGVIHTGLSDHSMIYVNLGKIKKMPTHKHKYKTNRSFKKFNDDDFVNDIRKANWCSVKHDNVDKCIDDFEKLFLHIADKHAPMKTKRVCKVQSPWLTDDIIAMMRERDDLKRKAIRTSCDDTWDAYRTMRNRVNLEIKQSKKLFLSKGIKDSGKNSRKVWSHLRHIVPGKNKSNNISNIKTNDGVSSDPEVIANSLNDYFANIGPTLAQNMQNGHDNVVTSNSKCEKNEVTTIKSVDSQSFSFKPVSHEYVHKYIATLSESKATGNDNISARLLKKAGVAIIDPITHIINLSLKTGMFPKSWKKARVNPIYKGTGEKTDPGNYRPIAILPVLSKICERAVFDQLHNHIKGKLYSCQSGFRPGYSTETSLLNITDDWFDAIDKGNVIGLVMLDLKKAFDTVHHETLIDKLKFYDLDDKCIAWFKDYLSNRSHNVSVNGISSKQADCVCGIPQGSIL